MFNRKICKKIIAIVMSCILAAGAAGAGTAFAAGKKSDVIEVSTRQELYDALIGLLCKEIPESEYYNNDDDDYDEDYDEENYDSDEEDDDEKSNDDITKEGTEDEGKTSMVHVINDEYDDLSNLPRIIIKGYNPHKFYVGEVLYDVNKYIVEKAKNPYGKYLTGSPVKVYNLKKKSIIKKDITKPVDVYLDFSGVEWRKAGSGDDDSGLKLPESGKIVKSNKEYYQYILKCIKKDAFSIEINKFYSYPYIAPLEQAIQACCDNSYELYSCQGVFYSESSKDEFSDYYMVEEGKVLHSPTKKELNKGKKLEKEAKKVLKKIIKKGMSDTQKVKAIHNYLVKNCTYDTNIFSYVSYNGKIIENPNALSLSEKMLDMHTPYAAVVKKRAVCEGYAKAFNIMALKSGLKSVQVSGTANGAGGWGAHMWNAVKINGKIKYVDVTFDDPSPIDYKNPFKHLINNKKIHTTYLLKDAQAIKKDHKWDAKQVKEYFKYIETSGTYKMYNKYCA